MNEFKEQLVEKIKTKLKVDINQKHFTQPPDSKLGDLAFGCFPFAKQTQKDPVMVAKEIKELVQNSKFEFLDKVEVAGPYVNFFIKIEYLNKAILQSKLKPKNKSREKIMIEYSQPNTHKEFHVGHSRNAILGSALVNVYRFFNVKDKNVIAANYIGDTGVHVAKCLWYLLKFNPDLTIPKGMNPAEYLGQAYADAVTKLSENEQLNEEVSEIHKKLDAGDKELHEIWLLTKEWSMLGFYDVYYLLNIEFNEWFWESEEEKNAKGVLDKIIQSQQITQIKKSEGAIIADLQEFNLDVVVLVKSDGNLLYGAKDIPLGMKKFDHYKVDKSVYVVDNRQSLYIKQIFKILDLLGYEDKEKIHVAYDFVTLPDGAMASRKGNVISFMNFYEEIFAKTLEETAKRHDEWPRDQIEAVASRVALSAIKFFMLKYDNNSVIVFDVEKALSFDGDTGPYLLYTLARINSILKKTKVKKKIDYALLSDENEKKLILHMAKFIETVEKVAEENAPMKLTNYLIELAQLFNNFYHNCPVLKSEEKTKFARLFLSQKVQEYMKKGLSLLNIETVDEM